MTQSFPSPSSSSGIVPSPRPSVLSVQQGGDLHYSYSLNDPRIVALEDLDDAASMDGASMISSSFSAFGDSSEVAGFTTPANVQQKQAEQMNAAQEEQKNEAQKTPNTNDEQVTEKQTTNGNGNKMPKEEEEEVKLPPSSLFAQDIILTPFGKPNEPVAQSQTEQKTNNAVVAGSKDSGDSAVPPVPLQKGSSNGSMDLESSELLLKSRSPAPFSAYSSASPDHIGTIRKRQHSPVKLNLNDTTSSSEVNILFFLKKT